MSRGTGLFIVFILFLGWAFLYYHQNNILVKSWVDNFNIFAQPTTQEYPEETIPIEKIKVPQLPGLPTKEIRVPQLPEGLPTVKPRDLTDQEKNTIEECQ